VNRIWTAVVLTGAGTFAMRASFLAAATRMTRLPPTVLRLLRQIPPAALSSLVLPALVRPEGRFDLVQPRLLAGVLAGIVAWRTRNVALTLGVGLGLLMGLEAL